MSESNNLPVIIDAQLLPPEEEHDADLAYARENIHIAIRKAQTGLTSMADIAYGSQQPRAYEVQNQYIKTLADLSKDLVQVSKLKKQSKEVKSPRESRGRVQNNLFVGSTAELAKMLKTINENSKE